MTEEYSVKVNSATYKSLNELIAFFNKRYGYRGFTKKKLMENSLRVYTDYVKQVCSESDEHGTPMNQD